ncbi:hypothetical protein ACIF8Z_14680 [Pseudomonas promysalinigenes]|jgi:hypothetical protein|uniref:Uncharacterized protein n=1 Tax=Pseudomonas promysalinigenes TaxID=485898 RepID=A0ABY6AQK7_9PSED|nr:MULTISPECIES: hypothetical protein [Pseudomonas]UXH41472.1 hypothetical protein N5C08_08095 [Pseudomonas promysalinigenes]
MNFNLFPVIAASAISASVVLPAHAHADGIKATATHSYTQQYLRQSATFYAALSGKHSH